MKPEFASWEYWQAGDYDIVPVRWVPGEAWALIKGTWTRVNSTEVSMEARMLNEKTYKQAFEKILVPLPSNAFKTKLRLSPDAAASSEQPSSKTVPTQSNAQTHDASTKGSLDFTGFEILPPDGTGFVITRVPRPKTSPKK
jgi:hypothetical protein